MALLPYEIAQAWDLAPEGIEPLGRGRINRTFLALRRKGGTLVVQRLNGQVFPRPDLVMANVRKVLDHLPPGPLRLVPTVEGADALRDAEGHLWRAWLPIEGARTVEGHATPQEAFLCARAFGAFLRDLEGLSSRDLHATLPGFHDTSARLRAFEAVAASADASLDPLRARILRLAPLAPALEGLPERVAHYDTKLNNVLLRAGGEEALAVIDLDTVQSGSWAVDFGDMARSACNPAGEDPELGATIRPDLATFEALAKGFLGALAPRLTPDERDRLAVAPAVLAFELGLRFLTDHLQGDQIFHAAHPAQNRHRAEVQLALAEGFLAAEGELRTLLRAAG